MLNNCIGKRTLRVFVLFLLVTSIFYLSSGVVAAIGVLYEPYMQEYKEDGKIIFDYGLIVDLILVCLQLVKFVLLCCMRDCVDFSVAVIWILVEAVLVLGLAISTLQVETIAAAVMLSLSLSFFLFVWPLLTKHWGFIAHHLTEKEFHARLDTMMRLQIEDTLITQMGCAQKCKNLTRFFCCRKIPKSEVLTH